MYLEYLGKLCELIADRFWDLSEFLMNLRFTRDIIKADKSEFFEPRK